MHQARIAELRDLHRDGLLKDTLPFWLAHTLDPEYGGFLNQLDRQGQVYGTDKPVWILGRFTWLLSLLYNNVQKREEWLSAAALGADFIRKHCFDTDGRMFFLVTRDGRPVQKRRYLFTETFGIIALSEYALATGNEEILAQAKELYQRVICYYQNPHLLPPKYFPQGRQGKAHAMPMILLATTQQLRKAGDDPLYDRVIDDAIYQVTHHFMRYDEKALLETVGPNGERIDSPEGRSIIPGHAIETAWFLLTEAQRRNDKNLIEKACLIIDWSLERGWDNEFGGLLYYTDVEGKPCTQYEHDMKLWWPHNETLYACLLAYHLTGDEKYSRWYEKAHDYAFSHFPDKDYGEWFKYLHRDGTVSHTLKGNLWAGPFHLPRMQYNCWKLLDKMAKDGSPQRMV